jgi:hypothetical protein
MLVKPIATVIPLAVRLFLTSYFHASPVCERLAGLRFFLWTALVPERRNQ